MYSQDKFRGQALNYVVIVKEKIVKNETASGFDLTTEVDHNIKYRTGIIVSVGSGCPKKTNNLLKRFFNFIIGKDSFTVKEGDEIMFDKHKSSDLTIDGIMYRCIYYADLMLML